MKFSIDKFLMIITAGFTLLLITMGVIYMIQLTSCQAEQSNTIILIIVLILGSLLATFLIRSKQEQKTAVLQEAYKEAYDQMSLYLSTANISMSDRKKVKEDLLSLLYEAQSANKDIKTVIGDDANLFADKVIAAHGGKRTFLVYMLSGLQFFLGFILIMKGYDIIKGEQPISDYFLLTVDYSSILYYFLASFIIIPLIFYSVKIASQKKKPYLLLVAMFGSAIIFFVSFVIFMETLEAKYTHLEWAYSLVNGQTPIFTNIAGGVLIVAVALGIFLIKKILHEYQLKNDLNN